MHLHGRRRVRAGEPVAREASLAKDEMYFTPSTLARHPPTQSCCAGLSPHWHWASSNEEDICCRFDSDDSAGVITRDVKHRRDSPGERQTFLFSPAHRLAVSAARRKAHYTSRPAIAVRQGRRAQQDPAAGRPVRGGIGSESESTISAPSADRGPYRTTCESPWVRLRRANVPRTQPSPGQ